MLLYHRHMNKRRTSKKKSRWERDFPPVQTSPRAHPASCTMGTGSFPGVKCGRGVLLTTHPLLVPRSCKSRAIPLPTFWATPGLYRDHFTFIFTYLFCNLIHAVFGIILKKRNRKLLQLQLQIISTLWKPSLFLYY